MARRQSTFRRRAVRRRPRVRQRLFGSIVRTRRRALEINLEDLAKATGLNIATLSLIENDKQKPPEIYPYVLKIAENLEFPPDSKEFGELLNAAARQRFRDFGMTLPQFSPLNLASGLGFSTTEPRQATTGLHGLPASPQTESPTRTEGLGNLLPLPALPGSSPYLGRSLGYNKQTVLEAFHDALGIAANKGVASITIRTNEGGEEHTFYVAP